ncbi:regulator [Streptomyces sp. NPDC059604]|uniref:regulator n=1 Tax=Streptomyces sp. NPDC059604 TaxID=3346881 RepID=UPI003675C35F
MNTFPSSEQIERACTDLTSAALIRLLTEIDDHGPIPPRGLARTLPDLTPHQIRHATERARTLGLIRTRPGTGLGLTGPGRQLADLYDSAARWSRTHTHPRGACDFTARVQSTFRLLAPGPDPVAKPSAVPAEADEDLTRLRTATVHWISNHWTNNDQDFLEAA